MQGDWTSFLLLILVIGVASLIFLQFRKKDNEDNSNMKDLRDSSEKIANTIERLSEQNRQLADQNRSLRQSVDAKLSETHRATQEQMGQTIKTVQGITGQSAKLISEVTEKLTKLDETNKQIVNFSSQLQNLQDILKNPKQRGVLGEYFLEETLKNVLPPNSYQMQYNLGLDKATKKELIVDAVVFVKEKIIPIDSKFSLENYERILSCTDAGEREKWENAFRQDLKLRIDETAKYVRPGSNTMDFAFMFIPSEAVYYDLLINKVGSVKVNTRNLVEYAFRDKHVVIVSPTSFLAYLQTVLQGLRAMQIEESAKAIKSNVEKLGRHIKSYDDFMKKLGTSMSTTVNHYNNAYKEFNKMDKDVVRITEGERNVEPIVVDKPRVE